MELGSGSPDCGLGEVIAQIGESTYRQGGLSWRCAPTATTPSMPGGRRHQQAPAGARRWCTRPWAAGEVVASATFDESVGVDQWHSIATVLKRADAPIVRVLNEGTALPSPTPCTCAQRPATTMARLLPR